MRVVLPRHGVNLVLLVILQVEVARLNQVSHWEVFLVNERLLGVIPKSLKSRV